MLRLDGIYVVTWSLGRDLRILLRTVPAVLSARGAN
jgi:lipopolysaccharide/colanic/teichoic acid biosynthesis glycosyltransferase